MFSGRFRYAILAALVVLVPFCANCSDDRNQFFNIKNKKTNKRCLHPSSCGRFHNLSYPFRFHGDAQDCGDKNYEIFCENNRAVLYLYSGKYYVEEINYNYSTIRLVDTGIDKDNCSSIPLSSLTQYNFSDKDPFSLSLWKDEYPFSLGQHKLVAFLNCENQVLNSPLYMDSTASNCTNQAMRRHSYVLAGELNVWDVADACSVEMMVIVTSSSRSSSQRKNYSLEHSASDIHSELVHGFKLSWKNIRCEDCRGWGYCYLDFDYNVGCLYTCTDAYGSPFICTLMRIFWLNLGARFLILTSCILAILVHKWRRKHLSVFDAIQGFLRSQNNLMPIRYSYSDLKKMTKGFKDKLGEGGYGTVYKGKLQSGVVVAVKRLSKSKGNGQEFINEVATIGRIHHVNVVQLIGYCAERSKRALVYEFMPNGSLEKYVFCNEGYSYLSCEKMYEISIGVARGIEYLHRGCDMQILHFDIKPHNILLDENFTPKISDFGLAKLHATRDSIVTLTAARGTMGYMAPELFYKNLGGVSYKADVYSFGMLLMEMAGRRRNLMTFANHSSQIYFPSWVYDQFSQGKVMEMGDASEEERNMIHKMIIVALWCIQMKPCDRPSTQKIVEMLEGNVELLQMPPKPDLCGEEIPMVDQVMNTIPTPVS